MWYMQIICMTFEMCLDIDSKILAMTNLAQRESLSQQDAFSHEFLYLMMNNGTLSREIRPKSCPKSISTTTDIISERLKWPL